MLHAEEYIDLNSGTVKFLFETAPGVRATLYLGESREDLQPVKTVESYNSSQGLKVGGLTPGKEYFYRIAAEQGGVRVESETRSFVKLQMDLPGVAEWAGTGIFYEIFVRSFYDGNGDGIGDEVAGSDGRAALSVMHNLGRKESRVKVRVVGLRELLSGKKTGRILIVKPYGTAILAEE